MLLRQSSVRGGPPLLRPPLQEAQTLQGAREPPAGGAVVAGRIRRGPDGCPPPPPPPHTHTHTRTCFTNYFPAVLFLSAHRASH